MNIVQPRMIVIEGLDGVGKTTIARLLEKELGFVYLYTPQPPFDNIRIAVEEMQDVNTRFFFYLSSVIAVQPFLREMISAGKRVVVDRYIYSTLAMHTVLGANVQVINLQILPILWPDLGILLTADLDARLGRLKYRASQPAYDQQTERLLKEVKQAEAVYRSFEDLFPLDTSNLSAEQVFKQVQRLINGGSRARHF